MTRPIPGPHPDPRRPDLRLPPGACDSHCHVFGPSERFPYSPDRCYTPPDAPLERYLALMDTLGLQRAVIVQPSVYGSDNACTEDAIRRLAGRGRGVAVLDPGVSEQELARLDGAGFRGARFNLVHTGGSASLDALETVAAKIAPLGWHVQLYLRGRILPDILPRLGRLPVDVVIDHMGHLEQGQGLGQPGFTAMRTLLEGGAAWVKLCPYRFDHSGPPYDEARPFALELDQTAPERMVWGTDWPHPDVPGPRPGEPGPMPDDGDLVDALDAWFPDEATIRRIVVENPARLYGFD